MVILSDILSKPVFSNVRIVSGHNGIGRAVAHAGFLDWESGKEIRESFSKDEFVVTTLAVLKDNPQKAEQLLMELIVNGAAAIAIKDVYFHTLSERLLKFSDERNVPIMFFSDTYIDDMLYEIKSALAKDDSGRQEKLVLTLLGENEMTPGKRRELALKIDPLFEDRVLFCAFISADEGNIFAEDVDFGSGDREQKGALGGVEISKLRYSFVKVAKGAFFICTVSDYDGKRSKIDRASVASFLNEMIPMEKGTYRAGLSGPETVSLEGMGTALREALTANLMCCIKGRGHFTAYEGRADNLLCRLLFDSSGEGSEDGSGKDFYRKLYRELSAEAENPERIIATMETYVTLGGDVVKTAEQIFQHSNTVRYRLQKVKKAWKTENDMEFDTLCYIFCRLRQMFKLLEAWGFPESFWR